jgi:hypothetical protein
MPISNELLSSWWSPEIGLHLLLRAHITGCHPSNRWVLSWKQEIIALSKVCNVNNTNVLEGKIVVFSLVATTNYTTLEVSVISPDY